jgi:hypothetical protein
VPGAKGAPRGDAEKCGQTHPCLLTWCRRATREYGAVRAAYAGARDGGAYLLVREPRELGRMFSFPKLCWFIGTTSAFESIGWFIAAALANTSYCAAVAQVRIVFALLLSSFYFGERIRALEIAGISYHRGRSRIIPDGMIQTAEMGALSYRVAGDTALDFNGLVTRLRPNKSEHYNVSKRPIWPSPHP